MKCPNCGKWNQASMPHCMYCGTPFPTSMEQQNHILWQKDFNDREKPKTYIRVGDDGQIETTEDPRDVLAAEMSDLKIRMQDGRVRQEQLNRYLRNKKQKAVKHRIETDQNTRAFFEPLQNGYTDHEEMMPLLRSREEINRERRNYQSAYSIHRISEAVDQNDGFQDEDSEIPLYEDIAELHNDKERDLTIESGYASSVPHAKRIEKPDHRHVKRTVVMIALLIISLGAVYFVVSGFILPLLNREDDTPNTTIMVAAVMRDDMAAHEITIPGKEGQRIVLKELRTSKIVTDGVATFDIPDYTWYSNDTDESQESMTVTLSPYVVLESGRQQALEQIQYDINIPLSPIELISPDALYKSVSMSMYTISFRVRKESNVIINGKDYSDLVREGNSSDELTTISYNATVQPIGANVFDIIVRSQYCRENRLSITLDRAVQDIPLDLASDTAISSSSANAYMTVRGTTLPGAVVKVLSPYADLDITNTSRDGSFSFKAKFDRIGNNTIVITVDFPGRQTTRLEHIVNYVPNIDVYSRKAWDIKTQYSDLMDNIELRKKNAQIYVCRGVVTEIDTTKPQRAFMNVGTAEDQMLIYIENNTNTTWEADGNYRIYADVYGMYNSVPWLIVRYCYNDGAKAAETQK